jgi:hypothetical protein
MHIELYNTNIGSLKIKQARVVVETTLGGVRYLMRQWFFTSGFCFISGLTGMITAAIMIALLVF